jgi:ParB-like chromosome segregation protein Spo0J
MAVGDLHAHPENPNRGDIVTIARSLKQFGQYRSVVANKDGTILAGHHVWQAARSIRMPSLRVDMVDADEQSARKILLADNRIADLGPGPDMGLLLEALNRVDDLDGTGFDNDYIAMLEEMNAGAPSLNDLEDEAGGPPGKEDFYRRISLTIDPRLATRWERYRKDFPDDTEALAALLQWSPDPVETL